jgi:ketosteroid isomerase-like protein
VSQQNVELVRSLQPARDANLAQLFRDDMLWAAMSARLAPALAPKVKVVGHGLAESQTFEGVEGLRVGWLEWLAPWEIYRTEVEEAIDLGDRVVVLVNDFGRRASDTHEVAQQSGAVWTVRKRKVARIDFYADRREALKAVGLEK